MSKIHTDPTIQQQQLDELNSTVQKLTEELREERSTRERLQERVDNLLQENGIRTKEFELRAFSSDINIRESKSF